MAERADKTYTTRPGNLFQHAGIEVKAITPAFQRVIKAGGKIIGAVRKVKTNNGLVMKQAYVSKPDGATIELIEIFPGHIE